MVQLMRQSIPHFNDELLYSHHLSTGPCIKRNLIHAFIYEALNMKSVNEMHAVMNIKKIYNNSVAQC